MNEVDSYRSKIVVKSDTMEVWVQSWGSACVTRDVMFSVNKM
jgi:hypothetical protein